MTNPPSIGAPPPAPRRPRGRRRLPIVGAAVAIVAIVGGVMWLSGSVEVPPPVGASGTVPTEPAITAPPATTTAPQATVPSASAPSPTTSTPSVPTAAPAPKPAPRTSAARPADIAPNGSQGSGPPRALPDRTKERLPARPPVESSQVTWADARTVARNALDVAEVFATSDGRQPKRHAAAVKDLVAPNVAERMVAMFGNGSPTPKGVKQTGQLLSANLQQDAHTGARYAIVIIRRTFDGRPTEAILRLEFAPTQPLVTDFDYQPIVSG